MASNHINIQHYIFDITIPLQRPNKTERILITKSQTNMSVYSPYTCGIPELKAFNHSYIRGSLCNHSPMNVPSLPYTYLGTTNHNYQMYPGHEMYLPRQESSKKSYNTGTECRRIPNIETVLRAQVQDYITLGLEKQITEVSTTKESTKILKNWLQLHRNNPYPSKTEKVMLAYSTRMTITQISNWFGNVRRRIKQQKSCDKSHDSLLESSYDENLHRSLQENAQMIKSSVTSGHPRGNETTPEIDQKIIDNSFQISLDDTYATPDSGLESFTENGDSLESKEDVKNDLKGEIKCKTNLFGTDPVPDVMVEPLEVKQNTSDVLKGSKTAIEISNSKTKIWSITDILNAK